MKTKTAHQRLTSPPSALGVPLLSLFTSAGTLVCCALPALLVSLGAGATLAGLVAAAPWLVALSAHKDWVFSIAGLLLAFAIVMQWHARSAPCPADPAQAMACRRMRQFSVWVTIISIAIFGIGAFFAFLADDLLL